MDSLFKAFYGRGDSWHWERSGVRVKIYWFWNTWRFSQTRCASLPMQMWSRRPATVPNGAASRGIDPSEAFMTEKIFHYEDQYCRLAWKHTFHYELGVNPASHLCLFSSSLENLGSRIKAAPQKSLSPVWLSCCQGTKRRGDNRKWFHRRSPFKDGTPPPRVHWESDSTSAAQETKAKLFQVKSQMSSHDAHYEGVQMQSERESSCRQNGGTTPCLTKSWFTEQALILLEY